MDGWIDRQTDSERSIYMSVCIYVTKKLDQAYTYTCTYTFTRTYRYAYQHMYIYIYICNTYIYIYIHIHIYIYVRQHDDRDAAACGPRIREARRMLQGALDDRAPRPPQSATVGAQ